MFSFASMANDKVRPGPHNKIGITNNHNKIKKIHSSTSYLIMNSILWVLIQVAMKPL